MDDGGIFLVSFTGVMAFLMCNFRILSGTLGTSDRLAGLDRRDPAASPPPAVVARIRGRALLAMPWCAAAVVGAGIIVVLAGRHPDSMLNSLMLCAAATGQAGALAVIGAGEAFRDRTPGPRVSRGRATCLADFVAPWSWPLVSGLDAAFLALALPDAWASEPQSRGWLVACMVAGASTLGLYAVARWAASRPQRAASEIELRWDDQLRAETLGCFVLLGPLFVLSFFGVARGHSDLGGGLLWGFMGGVIVASVSVMVGVRRRYARRLWSGATVTVSRPDQGRSADARR